MIRGLGIFPVKPGGDENKLKKWNNKGYFKKDNNSLYYNDNI